MKSNDNIPSSDTVFEKAFSGARKATKRKILQAALVCFNSKGIEATSIDDIRECSDSSTGTIYHHFGNKEGIVATLYVTALQDQHDFASDWMEDVTSPKQAVRAVLGAYLQWVTNHPDLARFLYKAHYAVAKSEFKTELDQLNKELFKKLHAFILQAVEKGEVKALPKEVYASLLIGQSEVYCRSWVAGRVSATPSDYIDVFAEAAWNALKTQ